MLEINPLWCLPLPSVCLPLIDMHHHRHHHHHHISIVFPPPPPHFCFGTVGVQENNRNVAVVVYSFTIYEAVLKKR